MWEEDADICGPCKNPAQTIQQYITYSVCLLSSKYSQKLVYAYNFDSGIFKTGRSM